jgi:hypothetical protein
MPDLCRKALDAKRESKSVEFKQGFDPSAPGDWCEVIKDIVAMANSGGGIIVFGVDNSGKPTQVAQANLEQLDPADIANRIAKYTGPVSLEFEIRELRRAGAKLQSFLIHGGSIPIAFQKPGTYEVTPGKQRTAFGVGTVYFRHGAKSEPGTTEDIRNAIERQLDAIRRSWLKGVRKVVQAPEGSQIVALPSRSSYGHSPLAATSVRIVRNPKAIPIVLTRDRSKATGSLVHEEISEGIFDEINNVIDANRVLAKGQQKFFLGSSTYYRIYAERHHVEKEQKNIALLFRSAVVDLYAPAAFWILQLPPKLAAQAFVDLYLQPKSPYIHFLMRMAILLGNDFCEWLHAKWDLKWKRYSQPPTFYFTFKQMVAKLAAADPRLISARATANTRFQVEGEPVLTAMELLQDPQRASSALSKACFQVFKGEASLRTTARELDYFAYGLEVRDRGPAISKAITGAIGSREPGDAIENATAAEIPQNE